MAYSNWGGFAYKNGERQPDHEDARPFGEEDLPAEQMLPLVPDSKDAVMQMHHVTLGSQRMRLCGYKDSACLYLDGKAVDLTPYAANAAYPHESGEGELEGYQFGWDQDDSPTKVDLWLMEPDGTRWDGFSGYAMGAGWED